MRLSSVILLFILSFACIGIQNASAQSVPTQPLFGFTWPIHSIPVLIESSQSNGTRAMLKAMNTWNLAQQWFLTTYMASAGTPFVLYEANKTLDSMVTVTFNQTQTVEDLGETHWSAFHDQQGFFKRVIVTINIDLRRQDGEILSDLELQTLATHELGHALGLDHTTFSPLDLMNHVPKVLFPSTLNLYAVYLLGQSTNENNLPQRSVTLPNSIPYMMVSQINLSTVIPPLIQSTTTSSRQLAQLITTMAYGPWPYVGLLIVLASVVILFSIRGRRQTVKESDLEEAEVVFHDKSIGSHESISLLPLKKKCRYCGADVRPEDLICGKCGMPAMYRK